MADPKKLLRSDIRRIIPDLRFVRVIERILEIIPDDLIAIQDSIDKLDQDVVDINSEIDNIDIESSIHAPKINRSINSIGAPRDYVEFLPNRPTPRIEASMLWENDGLTLIHEGGIPQVVGADIHIRAPNQTLSSWAAGTVIGAEEPITAALKAVPYIADGTIPLLNIVGIVSTDTDPGEFTRIITTGTLAHVDTTGSAVGETWAAGDTLYASPTTAGALTNIKPTAPSWSIPMAVVALVDATEGVLSVRTTIDQSLYYGSFSRTSDATLSATNTATVIDLDNEESVNGVTLDGTNPSRMVVGYNGLYSINVTWQFSSSSASAKNVWVWLRKNGTDIPHTARVVTITGTNTLVPLSFSWFISMMASDYIEVYWAADSTAVTLDYRAATAFAPSASSMLVTVEQIHQ